MHFYLSHDEKRLIWTNPSLSSIIPSGVREDRCEQLRTTQITQSVLESPTKQINASPVEVKESNITAESGH